MPVCARQASSAAGRRTLPEGIQSILVGIHPYYSGDRPGRNLSLYAVVPDYHVTLMNMLERAAAELKALAPGHVFLPFADNSPIREVDAACRAGLGVRGRNNLLITPRFGSFVFIGEILTTLPFEGVESACACCDGCGLCAAACPTSALSGSFKRERCLSYLTQKKASFRPRRKARLKAPCLGCGSLPARVPPAIGARRRRPPAGGQLVNLASILEGFPGQFRKAYGGRRSRGGARKRFYATCGSSKIAGIWQKPP